MFPKPHNLGRNVPLTFIRSKSVIPQGSSKLTTPTDVNLSNRRVMKKIRLGKARPAIFHQFDTLVELSDGSVIRRFSQAPKDEIRMINDQRTSSLWNPHRSDLKSSDLLSEAGKIGRFKSKYGGAFGEEEAKKEGEQQQQEEEVVELSIEEEEKLKELERQRTKKNNDDLFSLMSENAEEITGGQLYDKRADKKRFK